MDAKELYREGKLEEALQAALAAVRSNPSDIGQRHFLAALACFAGDLQRADKQLDAVSTLDTSTSMVVALMRQLIRAETSRQEFHEKGRMPEFLHEPTEEQKLRVRASIVEREGDAAEAVALLEQAEEKRTPVSGKLNGEAFDDLRDLDDLSASFFEVLTTTGKYFWVPFDQIDAVEFEPIEGPFDLIWRRAQLSVRGGPDGIVYVPVLYPGSSRSSDDAIRLGRGTDWIGGEGAPVRGLGQRVLLAGESDVPLLEVQTIELDATSSAEA